HGDNEGREAAPPAARCIWSAPVVIWCPSIRNTAPGDETMRRQLATRVVVAAFLSLLVPLELYAEGPKRDHDITVDDYFTQADIFEVVMSPSGQLVAYTEGR